MGKGGGLIGGASEVLFGDGGAGAAHSAAMAQQATAQRAFRKVTSMADEATTQGLLTFDKALAAQERNLARSEEMLKQIDPTILEASQQALRLLRGEESGTLAPVKAQRDQQRQKLLNSLREQLGPGAETSTAGIQALTRFDAETNSLLSGQQQSALQNLGQTFGTFSSYAPKVGAEASALAGLGSARAGLQFDRANLYQQAYQPLIGSAGANYTRDALRGQQNMAFGQTLLGAAATLGAGYLGGPAMAGAAPAAAAPQITAGQSYLNYGNLA